MKYKNIYIQYPITNPDPYMILEKKKKNKKQHNDQGGQSNTEVIHESTVDLISAMT